MPWRPLPTPDRPPREPVAVGEVLDRVTTAMGGPRASLLAQVFGQWEELVGPTVSAHARPQTIRGDTLVVVVDQPGWATQLRYLEAELVTRLGEATGGVVRAVDVRVDR